MSKLIDNISDFWKRIHAPLGIISCVSLLFLIQKSCQQKFDIARVQQRIDSSKTIIKKEINQVHDTIYSIVAKTNYEISKAKEDSLNKLAAINKINKKELERYALIVREYNLNKVTPTRQMDTVIVKDTSKVYVYKDNWLNLTAFVRDSLITFNNFHIKDSLNVLFSTKKVKGVNYRTVHVTSTNPYSSVSQMEYIDLKPEYKPSKFAVGIQAGYGYIPSNISHPSWYVGIGGTYILWHIK